MGGNLWECTTETISVNGQYTYVGGSFNNEYAGCPAGFRTYATNTATNSMGFRIALFL